MSAAPAADDASHVLHVLVFGGRTSDCVWVREIGKSPTSGVEEMVVAVKSGAWCYPLFPRETERLRACVPVFPFAGRRRGRRGWDTS